MKTVKISSLRPTQLTVGLIEASWKSLEMWALSARKRALLIAEKPAEVIIGPGGKPYLTNHHHVALAAHFCGVKRMPMTIVDDLSALTRAAFFRRLKSSGRVYLRNPKGHLLGIEALPRHLWEMQDDAFRSLAGIAKERGAYKDSSVPFAEFQWAEFFRGKIMLGPTKEDFDNALMAALSLSHSPKAKRLPGYCKALISND